MIRALFIVMIFALSRGYGQATFMAGGASPFQKNGVSIAISVWIEGYPATDASLFGAATYKFEISTINAVITKRIDYKGKTYYSTDFNSQLDGYFGRLEVTGITGSGYIDGLKDCKKFFFNGQGEGSIHSIFCTPENGKKLQITGFDITDVRVTGISELQRKIDELEDALKKQEEQKKLGEEQKKKQTEGMTSTGQSATSPKKLEEKKLTTEEQAARTAIARAQVFESEGDRLYDLGASYFPEALENYRKAQSIYQTERVKNKMDKIDGLYSAAQGLNDLGNSTLDFLDNIDPTNKFAWVHKYIRYERLLTDKKNLVNNLTQDQEPSALVIGLGGHSDFIAMDFNLGRFQSISYPRQIFGNYNGNADDYYLSESAEIRNTGLITSGAIGFYLPGLVFGRSLQGVEAYAQVGVDALWGFSSQFKATDFSISESSWDLKISTRKILGLNYRKPGSKIGFGLTYNMVRVIDSEDKGTIQLNYKGGNYNYDSYWLSNPKTIFRYNIISFVFLFSFEN